MIKNCLHCNSEFEAKPSEIKRGFAKFCSRSCSSQYSNMNKSKPENNVFCSYCGIPFYKNSSKQANSKSGLYFCCREHKDLAQRIGGIKEIQPSHYTENGNDYRAIAFKYHPHLCNRCGYDLNEVALVVHHKDYNHSNNDISNLEIICSNCHAIEHWAS